MVSRPPDLPVSPLLARGGYDVYPAIPGADTTRRLLAEATAVSSHASENRVERWDGHEGRGGSPERCFLVAEGGSVQDAFYRAPSLTAFLAGVVGQVVTPSGLRGSYSYYAHPGDFLGLHRDVEVCDLALITCLHDVANASGTAGALRLYPDRRDEPLANIRRSGAKGQVLVRLRPGESIVILGGLVPHSLEPVAAGQIRIVSVLCFRVGA
jgi:hypothetical protein